MMTEISLNILDIAENSVRAGADLITIDVRINTEEDRMLILIEDNGCGMTKEQIAQAEDPFFTTRTTRKVGLGISFYKMAAEMTGGSFSITSALQKGTCVKAEFVLSHVDRMPLGDISSTIHNLAVYHPDIDFYYTYSYNNRSFVMDTREFHDILGDIPFDTPDVSQFIMNYLIENKKEADGGIAI